MEKEKKEVIKHSSAIQITNEINLLQRRAWNVLLAYAYENLPTRNIHEIDLRRLVQHLKFDSKNIAYLKDVLRDLRAAEVEWNILGKDQVEEWGVCGLLAAVKIKGNKIFYEYSSELRRRLYNPAMYARISLSLQNDFKSKYSLALYELAVDFRGVGQTPWYTIEDFRRFMGVRPEEYSRFKDFNNYIIKRAITEVNRKSGLFLKVQYKREKRRIVEIKIIIKLNPGNKIEIKPFAPGSQPQAALPGLPGEAAVDDPEILQVLVTEFGLASESATQILESYSIFYIHEVLEMVRSYLQTRPIQDIPAFTQKAIEEDFRHNAGVKKTAIQE